MTQIQNVRRFDGVDDWLKLTSTDFVTAFGPLTFLTIIKTDIDPDVNYEAILSITGGTGGRFSFEVVDFPGQSPGITGYFDSPGAGFDNHGYFSPAMGWCLVGFTKPDGSSVTVRCHRYRYDTQEWDHSDFAAHDVSEGPAPAGAANMHIGTWTGSFEFLDADVAVVGGWMNDELSDGEIEGLTDRITAWDALNPTGLWLLNQSSVTETVLDRAGAGNQIGRNGTSVVTPTGLDFDVEVAPFASVTIR